MLCSFVEKIYSFLVLNLTLANLRSSLTEVNFKPVTELFCFMLYKESLSEVKSCIAKYIFTAVMLLSL